MSQVTTITFFKYKGLFNQIWAFGMMQFAHRYLKNTEGLRFYKLMGTGKDAGFNPFPDWSTYAILQVWNSQQEADQFIDHSKLMQKYLARASERWSLYLGAIQSKGTWNGENPFTLTDVPKDKNSMLAIITRASIRPGKLRRFWSYVPTSERPLANNSGLLFKKGIGEVPFLQMATFSIWKSEEYLKDFAYRSEEHAKAIKMTQELDWYSEELFARFIPIRSVGSWNGINPLDLI